MTDEQLSQAASRLPLAYEDEPMLLTHFQDILCEFSETRGDAWWDKHDALCVAYARWARPRDRNRDLMPMASKSMNVLALEGEEE